MDRRENFNKVLELPNVTLTQISITSNDIVDPEGPKCGGNILFRDIRQNAEDGRLLLHTVEAVGQAPVRN